MKRTLPFICCAIVALTFNSCKADTKTITLENISLGEALAMTVGDEVTKIVEVTPAELADELSFTWTSSDPEVATVDNAGAVVAVGAGSADISAKCNEYPEFVASCDVEVVAAFENVAISGGTYFGDMLTPDYDNYTYYIAQEGVEVDANMVFTGSGTALVFDMYAPLGTGVNLAEGTYNVLDSNLDGGTQNFTFTPGEDFGEGMLQGSFVSVCNGDDDEKFLITDGTVIVEKVEENYIVKADVTDANGVNYLFKYEGALNINDPFAGL